MVEQSERETALYSQKKIERNMQKNYGRMVSTSGIERWINRMGITQRPETF